MCNLVAQFLLSSIPISKSSSWTRNWQFSRTTSVDFMVNIRIGLSSGETTTKPPTPAAVMSDYENCKCWNQANLQKYSPSIESVHFSSCERTRCANFPSPEIWAICELTIEIAKSGERNLIKG
jgi:hypothetical protein